MITQNEMDKKEMITQNEMDKKDQIKLTGSIDFVKDSITVEKALGQLIEECAELIQAVRKLSRVFEFTADMTGDEALMNLAEECADVLNCLDVVEAFDLIDIECVNRIRAHKADRWCRRISSGDWRQK